MLERSILAQVRVAFELLEDDHFGYERDYFQPLPCQDFEGTVRKPAESEDVRAFTAAMLEDCGVPLFDEEGQAWIESESSSRI